MLIARGVSPQVRCFLIRSQPRCPGRGDTIRWGVAPIGALKCVNFGQFLGLTPQAITCRPIRGYELTAYYFSVPGSVFSFDFTGLSFPASVSFAQLKSCATAARRRISTTAPKWLRLFDCGMNRKLVAGRLLIDDLLVRRSTQ